MYEASGATCCALGTIGNPLSSIVGFQGTVYNITMQEFMAKK